VDREGRQRVFSNNLIGVIKDGFALRAWGTQRDVTERKRMEEELRATEHRFFMFMENLPGLAWIKDAEGRYVYVNEAAAQAFRMRREELHGKRDEEIFPAETAAQFRENDRQALTSEAGVLTTVETLAQSDGLHYSIVSKFRIPGHNGAARMVGGMAIDITERMRAEEAIRESERRLRLVTDHAPVFITYCGVDRTYRFVNKAYAERLGLHPAEVVGRPIHEVIGQEAYSTIEPYIDAVLSGRRVEYETEVPYQGIGARHMWVAYEPEFDDAGRVTGFVSAILDITERKRAEERLRESEERFAKAFEASPLALTITSLGTGRLLEVNETFTRMSGYRREEAVGRTTLELGLWVRPSDREAELATIAQRGQVRDTEYRFRMKDGRQRVGLLSAEQIEIGGEPCALTVINDITEQKHVEAERERLLEREKALRARAEEASRLKDEFLATVSHELRTPLTAILGWATVLRSNRFDGEGLTHALETIERNAKNQKQIIEDLLDVSRIITGKLSLEVRPVELASLLDRATESLRPAAEAKEVRLQKVLDTGLNQIAGDAARLQQVIWNLLSNAIKFTPRGGLVQIKLERVDSHVQITVSDTGQGISAEFLPFVFDRFRQADSTTTRKHGGLGLGLAIVRHLVELHGGTVKAESGGEGQGSIFTVTLPLMPAYHSAATEERKEQAAGDSLLAFDFAERLDGLKILAVDDEADTCELLKTALAECGAQVTTASSAQEALARLERLLPDVLISDIGMPDEDGYELIRRVRQLPAESGGAIPAVALTAYARAEDRLRVLREGYQMHVPKPVELAELVAVVASLVQRPKPA
jgi:PAS domain S-box-containing protein